MYFQNFRLQIRNYLSTLLKEDLKYINPGFQAEKDPLKDTDKIVVYHGFEQLSNAQTVAHFGLTGRILAPRIYSYEHGNNPKGWFVTIDFEKAKSFGHSGVIVEFRT